MHSSGTPDLQGHLKACDRLLGKLYTQSDQLCPQSLPKRVCEGLLGGRTQLKERPVRSQHRATTILPGAP
ncbi:hypothetical protein NDU88_001298 [Pleurodeles waltl]|uniref:Uncharacterized protein n=1 Tax=Pleurodeles waltl TaxID=8319 RepID=A0AAV7KRR2_PLEWA|nr:hypothetical protein NDU88_001298 [Pleurodeles waltl]